jgi:hypothetical protein
MKALFFISLLALSLLACEKEPETIPVSIDIQGHFDSKPVTVAIDKMKLIDGIAQANPSLGLAFVNGEGRKVTKLSRGSHTLTVQVDHQVTKREKFTVTDELYIGIHFDESAEEITIQYSAIPFMYD